MKRRRRIEIAIYRRRVARSRAGEAPEHGETPALDILLEALGDFAPAAEESRPDMEAGLRPPPPAPLLRRLLRLPRARGHISPGSEDKHIPGE